jgi:hypothetical protein
MRNSLWHPHVSRGHIAGCVACLWIVLAHVATAFGAGSPTIASAPDVEVGVQQRGNPAAEAASPSPCSYGAVTYILAIDRAEYWAVALTSGDEVVISGGQAPPAQGVYVCAYPPGTTDLNVAGATDVKQAQLDQGLTFTADATGRWPLAFDPYWLPGAFDFTLTVHHRALVFLPRATTIGLRASFAVYLRTPEGNPLAASDLTLKLLGSWRDRPFLPASEHLLATARPGGGGKAVFDLRVPRSLAGRTLPLTVIGSAPDFQPLQSATCAARIRQPRHLRSGARAP